MNKKHLAFALAAAACIALASCDQGTTPKADEPAKNADSALTALTLSTGTLSPAFTAAKTSYVASVSNATAGITVTPTASAAGSTIQVRVNGGAYAAVASGSASPTLALNEGTNGIDVKVTAENGSVTAYAITVARALPPDTGLSSLSLSAGTLDPAFASATTAYAASVTNATAGIAVTPTASAAGSTIQVRVNSGAYATVASGTASPTLALNEGSNAINVQVTAQNGSTATYTVTVTRLHPVPTITLDFKYGIPNPDVGNNIYVTWVEDMGGNVIQNLFICEKIIVDMTEGGLTGTALPYWNTSKYDPGQIDAVSGTTKPKQDFTITRTYVNPTITKFKVCFETDQSWDTNDWFGDQPALLYSAVVDLAAPQPSYALTLEAWTPNENTKDTLNSYEIKSDFGVPQTIMGFITHFKATPPPPDLYAFGAADTARSSTRYVGSITLKVE